jgi:hypothetical protein
LKFRKEKDLRLFVKKFLKERLKGLPSEKPFEVVVESLNPPVVRIFSPFYSEGNLLRAHEVDTILLELYNLGIFAKLFYEDDLGEAETNGFTCPCAE